MSPVVDDDDDDSPPREVAATETKPAAEEKAAIMNELFGDDDDSDDDQPAPPPAQAESSDDDDTDTDDEIAAARSKHKKATKAKPRRGRKEKGGKSKDISAREKGVWDKLVGDGEDDTEPKRDATDDAFIDDTDVAPEDRYGSDDEASPVASEAEEEDDELEKLFGSKGGRGGRARQSEAAITSEVLNFLARMEVATEQDRESVTAGRPAVHKLRMLKEMTAKLKEVDLHEVFLRHGLLKVLAQWLASFPDHNLPNTTVRTAVIDAVRSLPIETDLTDRKEERSARLGAHDHVPQRAPGGDPRQPEEVQGPGGEVEPAGLELSSQYRDLRQEVEVEEDRPKKKKRKNAVAGRRRRRLRTRTTTAKTRDGPKYGESPYRYHAVVPEPESLDYKVRPKLTIDPSEIKARTQNADQQRVRKLVGKVAKKKGIRDAKAYLPSVEGRGMVTYN